MPGFDQAAIDGYAVRSVDVSAGGARVREVVLAGDGCHRGRRPHPEPAAAQAGRAGPDRRADAHPGRRGAAVAVDRRRRRSGCGCCAACARVPTCGGPATTCSPATSRCAPGRSSVPRRWVCWPRSAANGCWCIRGRGCAVMSVGGELVDISRTPGNGQVYDVNSYALAAAARDAGAEVEPGRHRQHRPQGTARGGREPAQPRRGGGDRRCGRRRGRGEPARGAVQLGQMEVARIAHASRLGAGFRAARAARRFRRSCCRPTRSARWWCSR